MRTPRSLTFRLTTLFSVMSSSVLLVLGLLVGELVERHFEELDMALLSGKLELVSHALRGVRSEADLAELPNELSNALVGHHGLAVIVIAPSGRTLYTNSPAKFPDVLLAVRDASSARPIRWTDDRGLGYRGLSAKVPTAIPGTAPVVVAISTELVHHEHFMMSFRIALWSVMGLAALLTGFLGWIAARRGLAPLREIRQSAAEITANHLNRRLATEAIPAELAEVAETLNAMWARLEESFQRLSDFSSDLAHELRTPVSNLLTQTQVTLGRVRTAEEYREVLASNAEEFERLSRMIADMLFLAKSDNVLAIPAPEVIDLRAAVAGLFEYYEVLFEEKQLEATCSGDGRVVGDHLMIRRAVSNLLSNAVRHTPPGGRITVRIDNTAPANVTLTVENTGETIPAEHLPRLFDRFYRADPSRRHAGEGTGLGLAITRSIVRAHGGETAVRSSGGITCFEIRLPKAG